MVFVGGEGFDDHGETGDSGAFCEAAADGKLKELASHPALAMKPEWMGELARDEDWQVRSALAYNPAIANCPEAIQTLAADNEWTVCSALASNPALSVSPDAMWTLSAHESGLVRRVLATQPVLANIPDVMERLASDRRGDVRLFLSSNPALANHPEIIEVLAEWECADANACHTVSPAVWQALNNAQQFSVNNDSYREHLVRQVWESWQESTGRRQTPASDQSSTADETRNANPAIPTRTASTSSWQTTQSATQVPTI